MRTREYYRRGKRFGRKYGKRYSEELIADYRELHRTLGESAMVVFWNGFIAGRELQARIDFAKRWRALASA